MGDTVRDVLDPMEVNKDPQLIKDAQSEIGKLDVLVCGECHSIFHYIEQFQEHKLMGKCPQESNIIDSCINEQKPQVWAFMLWKSAKFKNAEKEKGGPSSWSVYQLWCNLDSSQKEAWVAAGKSIQSFTRLSTAKVQEVKAKIQPVQIRQTAKSVANKKPQPENSKEEEEAEDDPLEEGEIRLSQLSDSQRRAIKAQGDSTSADAMALETESELDTEDEVEREAALANMRQDKKDKKTLGKKSLVKPVQLNSDVTILPSLKNGASKKASRTIDNSKTEERNVEKIISRRYNPGKKTFEYLLKWENLDEDHNTWEPAIHLDSCKSLLEQFELNLKKQKAQKITQRTLSEKKLEGTPKKVERQGSVDSLKDSVTPGGRPQRTSKQKALDQVKAWCGNISDPDEASKRSLSDSDSDSVEKKIKLEPESSDSDDEIKAPLRKMKATALNGVGKKQALPDNVLVPDEQGIVRINQKQLPALSSGVYVMSKTAGIIKLDSDTSKIATSGGHAVIKVAPKIGQTSIKVIKKETITNGSKASPGRFKMTPKTYSPKIIKKMPLNPIVKKPATPPPKEEEDDESDGLEELEFPTDLPLPSPDSPPGEFTLDPFTGKIAGQEYPEEEMKVEEIPEENKASINLENIVNLAAADILQDKENIENTDGTAQGSDAMLNLKEEPSISDSSHTVTMATPMEVDQISNTKQERTENVTTISAESSTSTILSTALSNANIDATIDSPPVIVQRKQIIPTPTIRQKTEMARNIINRTIVPKPAPQAIITRITPGPNSRNKQMMQRPMMSPLSMHSTSQLRKPVKHSYSNRNTTRKINVYQSMENSVEVPGKTIVKTAIRHIVPPSTSNTVINMPLLTEPEPIAEPQVQEEEPSVPTETGELNTISLTESEAPIYITGEDGTIYEVAGQNEEGQTILITQGEDGQQQCLLVAPESAAELTQAATVAPTIENPQVEGPLVINTEQETEAEAEAENSEDSQVVAQIVSAQPPSPGGTRKVVLMLPDGNLMMTEVTAEQYAALELDK